jgi:hypothetical protein
VTLAVAPSVRPVHFPTPFHCAGGVLPLRPARGSLAMAVTTTPGFAALTSAAGYRVPFARPGTLPPPRAGPAIPGGHLGITSPAAATPLGEC